MKHDINLFDNVITPIDHRWDEDRNAKLLNIVYHGGTFGNFLKFFLDKFSTKTPNIAGDSFTEIGTSHNDNSIQYSGLIQKYHPSFTNDNKSSATFKLRTLPSRCDLWRRAGCARRERSAATGARRRGVGQSSTA